MHLAHLEHTACTAVQPYLFLHEARDMLKRHVNPEQMHIAYTDRQTLHTWETSLHIELNDVST